jgi:hypothetical protein
MAAIVGTFGQQADRGDLAVLRIVDVERVVIESRQAATHADHHGHRMRVAPEPREEAHELLMHHGVRVMCVPVALCSDGQLALEQQVADLQKVALLASCSIG